MNKERFVKSVKNIKSSLSKKSPEILTGIGIAGMITTTVLAVKATPKALDLIAAAEEEKSVYDEANDDWKTIPLTAKETIKATWKCYLPSVVTCTASVACLIGASSVNAKRNAALATAYALSETALKEYKEKVIETIGEKKSKNIDEAIAKDRIEKNPISKNEIFITGDGDTICYDSISGRYFTSNIDKLKKIENELNRRLIDEMYISLDDFYDEIGLAHTKLGNQLGWNVDRGLIELHFSAQLAENDRPCIVVDYHIAPYYDYQ